MFQRRIHVKHLAFSLLVVIVIYLYRKHDPRFSSNVESFKSVARHELQCKRHDHIYFLKVHKCGSTTIQSIFLRFALQNSLNVLTPIAMKNAAVQRNGKRSDGTSYTPGRLKNGKYDIFCEHSDYNSKWINQLQDDTVNIAILREPMSRLRSVFNYFDFPKLMNLQDAEDPVASFLQDPKFFCEKYPHAEGAMRTENLYAREFGFNAYVHSLQQYVEETEARFLVLIYEHLPESMILMKRRLCWGMKDVLYFHAKERHYTKPPPNETLENLNRKWSALDYTFYEHFLKVFHRTVANQANDFLGEVALFKAHLATTRAFCADLCSRLGEMVRQNANRPSIEALLQDARHFEHSPWEPAFSVSGLDCLLMTLSNKYLNPALDMQLHPEVCDDDDVQGEARFDRQFCRDHFAYTLPWSVLNHPQFHSACYEVEGIMERLKREHWFRRQ